MVARKKSKQGSNFKKENVARPFGMAVSVSETPIPENTGELSVQDAPVASTSSALSTDYFNRPSDREEELVVDVMVQSSPNRHLDSSCTLSETPTRREIQKHLDEQALINEQQLSIENVRAIGFDANIKHLEGNRIGNIAHIITESRRLESHVCPIARQGYLSFHKELSYGFAKKLVFKCTSCGLEQSFTTANEETMNSAVVWSSVASGRGFTAIQEMFSMMDIPCITESKYSKLQNELGTSWLSSLTDCMIEAGKSEWKLAEESGCVDQNGIGTCTVVVDGAWSHRSYGHSYTAKSGVACIVGLATKKLLHLGIKNKYCSICMIASRRGVPAQQHTCFKNWSGSSPGMEAAILVDGFRNSEAVHNLKYTKYIGDGDSSVEKKLKENVTYGRYITKVECANHMVKNVTKHLHSLAKESAVNKRLLTNVKINALGKMARKVIAITSKSNSKSVEELKNDLKNVPHHVFGNHMACKTDYCDKFGTKASVDILANAPNDTTSRIHSIIANLCAYASTLIENQTSNLAEQFMSLVAKFTGGKRPFYGRRDSFNIRCYGAGLLYQYGPTWMAKAWKNKHKSSPGMLLKRLVASRTRRRETLKPRIRRTIFTADTDDNNADYGPHCQRSDLPDDIIQDKITLLLGSLEVNEEKRNLIQIATKGQRLSEVWFKERAQGLTASHFGAVCKRRLRPGKLVKQILYGTTPRTIPIQYGCQNEAVALAAYESITDTCVVPCGFFINIGREEGYLGASPDGLVGDNGILEVKCPYNARFMTPEDACRDVKQFCCKLVDGIIVLNKNHDYHYQVQGQLMVTGKQYCDFVIWTPLGTAVERIERDDHFINEMKQKLKLFYFDHIALEIVDSRQLRNMPIRHSE